MCSSSPGERSPAGPIAERGPSWALRPQGGVTADSAGRRPAAAHEYQPRPVAPLLCLGARSGNPCFLSVNTPQWSAVTGWCVEDKEFALVILSVSEHIASEPGSCHLPWGLRLRVSPSGPGVPCSVRRFRGPRCTGTGLSSTEEKHVVWLTCFKIPYLRQSKTEGFLTVPVPLILNGA